MTVRDRLPGLALILAGIASGLEATTFDVAFLTDPVGPKALPLLVATVLVLSGVQTAARPKTDVQWPGPTSCVRSAASVAAFLVYALALPWIGFVLSTALVLAALSGLFGAGLRTAVPAAAIVAAGLWLLFVQLLGLPLPIGELWIL